MEPELITFLARELISFVKSKYIQLFQADKTTFSFLYWLKTASLVQNLMLKVNYFLKSSF